eukprot:GHVN01066339.1.p1 GENE.GHVN01066339.1~~GHVN01066339.1.p1  ORF type:complete len:472 (+),score=20.29 GHVN01066339.1:262-1677(+)
MCTDPCDAFQRCTFLVCLTSSLLGYDIGVIAGAIVLIKNHFLLTSFEIEVAVGCLDITATIGVLVAGRIADGFGRRCAVMYTSFVFLFGTIFMAGAWSYPVLVLGRLVTGFGIGGGLVITPLYVCELAPPSYRGALTSLAEVAICIGVLSGYVVNYMVDVTMNDSPDTAWRLMIGFGVLPPLLLLSGMRFVPESPRWLVMKGENQKAYDILTNIISSNEEAHNTLVEIQERETQRQRNGDTHESKVRAFFHWQKLDKNVKDACKAGMGLAFLSQATGIEAATYYSNIILQNAGFEEHRQTLAGTVIMGVFKLVAVLIFTFTADSLGRYVCKLHLLWLAHCRLRRPLIFASALGMTLSMLCFGLGHLFVSPPWYMLTFFVLFVCSFSLGVGPLTYLIPAELFPQPWRAWGVSSCLFIARFTSAIVAMTYLSVSTFLTPAGVAFLFTGFGALTVAFGYFWLPETKGVHLELIS